MTKIELKNLDNELKKVKKEIVSIESIPLKIISIKEGFYEGAVLIIKTIEKITSFIDNQSSLAASLKFVLNNDIYEGAFLNGIIFLNRLNNKDYFKVISVEELFIDLDCELEHAAKESEELIKRKKEALESLYKKEMKLLYKRYKTTNDALKVLYPANCQGSGFVKNRRLIGYFHLLTFIKYSNCLPDNLTKNDCAKLSEDLSQIEKEIFYNKSATDDLYLNRRENVMDGKKVIEDYVPANTIFDMYEKAFKNRIMNFTKSTEEAFAS